jgi:hypothetical protein
MQFLHTFECVFIHTHTHKIPSPEAISSNLFSLHTPQLHSGIHYLRRRRSRKDILALRINKNLIRWENLQSMPCYCTIPSTAVEYNSRNTILVRTCTSYWLPSLSLSLSHLCNMAPAVAVSIVFFSCAINIVPSFDSRKRALAELFSLFFLFSFFLRCKKIAPSTWAAVSLDAIRIL